MDSHQFLQYLIFLDQIQDTNPLLSKNFLNVILYKYFPNLKFLQFKAFFIIKITFTILSVRVEFIL